MARRSVPLTGEERRDWEFFEARAGDEPYHVRRWWRSAQWVRPLLRPGLRVLEAGGASPFSEWLAAQGAPVQWTAPADLRAPFVTPADPFDSAAGGEGVPGGAFDLIVVMEVVEHLHDLPDPAARDRWTGSGVRACLRELLRAAAPGAPLFLTTPNLCCWRGVQRLLRGEHPHQYPPHVREMPPAEVLEHLERAGWSVDRWELASVWGDHGVPLKQRAAISRAARQVAGSDWLLRGDCLFVLAHAPAQNPQPAG